MENGISNYWLIEVEIYRCVIHYMCAYGVILFLLDIKFDKTMGCGFIYVAIGQHDIFKVKDGYIRLLNIVLVIVARNARTQGFDIQMWTNRIAYFESE